VYQLLNEAMRCLDEGIIRNTRDGDIGAIFGIGFPPFLGGPYRLIDQIGAQHIVAKLTQWQQQFGDRFSPSEALVKLAESGNKLYSER
jgi:3-hydroxyacyl-CoA dehydrogenase/enoyl-CoA hydratase/3-hydroxybutyryl-CoA epimerase